MGMAVKLKHGTRDILTNLPNDESLITAKIALAHLKEYPDYYTRLEKMEDDAGNTGKARKNKRRK